MPRAPPLSIKRATTNIRAYIRTRVTPPPSSRACIEERDGQIYIYIHRPSACCRITCCAFVCTQTKAIGVDRNRWECHHGQHWGLQNEWLSLSDWPRRLGLTQFCSECVYVCLTYVAFSCIYSYLAWLGGWLIEFIPLCTITWNVCSALYMYTFRDPL